MNLKPKQNTFQCIPHVYTPVAGAAMQSASLLTGGSLGISILLKDTLTWSGRVGTKRATLRLLNSNSTVTISHPPLQFQWEKT